ncbi:hypothetical protein MXB_3810, partial [Myxobolus squamalis]
ESLLAPNLYRSLLSEFDRGNSNKFSISKIDSLHSCKLFSNWRDSLKNSGYLCLMTTKFKNCNFAVITAKFKILFSPFYNVSNNEFSFDSEFLELIKYSFVIFLTSRKDNSAVCCGIQYITKNWLEISFIYSFDSISIESEYIKNNLISIIQGKILTPLNMKIENVESKTYRDAKTRGLQITHLSQSLGLLSTNTVDTFDLQFSTTPFNDSGLENKKSPQYEKFICQLEQYLNQVITKTVPLIVKSVFVIDYKQFKVLTRFEFFQSNVLAFTSVSNKIKLSKTDPFIYNNQSIVVSSLGNLFVPDLCTGSGSLVCPINSFCYQSYSNAYCLCYPGYALNGTTCQLKSCDQDTCLINQFCIFIVGTNYC